MTGDIGFAPALASAGVWLALVCLIAHVRPQPRILCSLAVIESPCILVCSMDMTTGYCFGCGRTRDEISAWLTMSPADRRTIMAELPARLETVERKPRRETRRTRIARERGF